ncbi:hypothetical protein UA08_07220 [Talaromyces atroroseus]|uniref:tRNA-splicing endonuclease subunit Sen54 N-terminal domain-containing protein n=1 Tax=Talaromyces atroroseus TaxID=1441469 RepID=A0A225AJU4_TALAT|nr:hypothetical protein UA08_07220 [Talaromyces atroroseus]OKL57458.1 hypothetical protein UA08_07220 [Talaromyces atroroseus]
MADADEDVVFHPTSTVSAPQAEIDLSDEVQDFRFLNTVSLVTDPSQVTIPRRGEKDFEPNPTILQSDTLATSRNAMHNAISHPRLGSSKNRIVGIYCPEGPTPLVTDTNQEVAAEEDGKTPAKPKPVVKDPMSGIPSDACVHVTNSKGPFFKTVGKTDRWNRTWLLPEEALYLLERGTLDIRWPASITGTVQTETDAEEMDIPMSLQAAYACLMGRGGLTLERYIVYTGLKRLGYTLRRAPAWYGAQDEPETEPDGESRIVSYAKGISNCWSRFYNSIPNIWESDYSAQGPLIGFRAPRTYNAVFRKLALIPTEDAAVKRPSRKQTEAPFQFVYHVYKPNTPFKKSAPPAPDFRIAVVDARIQTSIPTLRQIRALLATSPYDPPKGEKMERHLYARLRQGYRSAILAIVDQGVVSYLRFGDAGFSKEKIFETQGPPRGPKTGGFSKNNRGREGKPTARTALTNGELGPMKVVRLWEDETGRRCFGWRYGKERRASRKVQAFLFPVANSLTPDPHGTPKEQKTTKMEIVEYRKTP